MKKGATSVRFSDAHSAILKKIAAAYDVKDVDVVRWAVKALGVYHARTGQLPPMEDAPLILHEPPRRVRPELMKQGDEVKTRTPTRKATSRG